MHKSNNNHVEIWDKCRAIIRDNIPSQSFKTWFDPIVPLKLEGNILTIQVPSQFFYEWIEENFITLLRSTLRYFLGPEAKLEYSIIIDNGRDGNTNYSVNIPTAPNDKDKKNPPVNFPLNSEKPFPTHWVMPGLKKLNIDTQLNPLFTFDSFINGDCNANARRTGLEVSLVSEYTNVNMIYVYGGFGLGKTHFIQAVGNEIKKRYPNKVILYLQCEKFNNQYSEAVKNNNVAEFINFYQLLDVLIIDDIQYMSGKSKTQETLVHVINHLLNNNKLVVFSGDVHPLELKGFEANLIDRFKWKFVDELKSPNYDTRVNILKRKMYCEGIKIPTEITNYIADNITSNVRELEGAMISLIAQSSLNRKEIDLELASGIVKNFVKNANREISIDLIQKTVSDYFNIPQEKLKEKVRKREIVQARQISMYFAKEFTKQSLKSIGLHFGGRDHSTVIHAVQTVNDLLSWDRDLRKHVEDIRKVLQSGKS